MLTFSDVADVIGRWWYSYDEGRFEVLRELLTDDVHFTCRTDTGTTDWEEFVRANLTGRDEVMQWQIAHRTASPYPLRHHSSNLHLEAIDGDEASFVSYMSVTHVVDGMPQLIPSGVVTGRVRRDGDAVRIAALAVVLDTRSSVSFSER